MLALEKVRVSEKSVRQKEQHLEMAQTRREAGVVTELDVLRSEVDLANARAQLEQARGEADDARGTLNAVMVRPVDAPIIPTDVLDRRAVDIDSTTVAAAAHRQPAGAQGRRRSPSRCTRQIVNVEKGEGRPRLDFAADYGHSVRQPDNIFRNDFARWNATVTLTVPAVRRLPHRRARGAGPGGA